MQCNPRRDFDAMNAALLTIFVLHESIDEIDSPARKLIHRAGFDVLATLDCLLPTSRCELLQSVSLSRAFEPRPGVRCRAYVTVDLCPWRPERARGSAIPFVDNRRLRRLDEINELLRRINGDERYAMEKTYLAATPNTAAAWRLLEQTAPESASKHRADIEARERAMTPPFPVLRDMTEMGNSARTYVVTHRGEKAICKVFRPGRLNELRNELFGLGLASAIPEIPKCLEAGENWLVTEYLADARPLSAVKGSTGLIPLRHAKRTFEVLRAIHEAGFAHLDFRPDHVLILPNGRLSIIDFDRGHLYASTPAFENSLPIVGYDDTRFLDGPNGLPSTYARTWQPRIGLNLVSLMRDPVAIQHVKRLIYSVRQTLLGAARRLKRVILGSERSDHGPSIA